MASLNKRLTNPSGMPRSHAVQAFARMVEAVGCENVHLRCNATDLDFARSSAETAIAHLGNCMRLKVLKKEKHILAQNKRHAHSQVASGT